MLANRFLSSSARRAAGASALLLIVLLFPLLLIFAANPAQVSAGSCAESGSNLLKNGTMSGGPVASNWSSFVVSANRPNFENAGNEGYDPNGSQYIWRDLGKWDAGIYQTVTTLTPGQVYHFWIVWGQALHDMNGDNKRATLIDRQIGVDLSGGTNPQSPNIVWTVPYYGGSGFNRIEWNLYFKATGTTATFFLRAQNSHTDGRNKVFFDTACLYPSSNSPTTTPWSSDTPPNATPTRTFTPKPTRTPISGNYTDDTDPSLAYKGAWQQGADANTYKGTYHRGRGVTGAPIVLTYNFTGSQIGMVYVGYRDHGIANVIIDGVKVGKIDQYTPKPVYNMTKTFGNLAPGPHVLKIKNAGQKNPSSSNNWIIIDALVVSQDSGFALPAPAQFHAVSEVITVEPKAPTPTPTNAPPRLIPFQLARVPAPTPSDPSVIWDSRLPGLNVSLQTAQVTAGTLYWKLIRADYNDPFQHTGDFGGDHEMYYVVTDPQGKRIANQKVWQSWPDDATSAFTKSNGIADIPMWANYFPDRGPGPYSGYMDGLPSDVVRGMGLPANNHVSFILYFQKTIKGSDSDPPSATPTFDVSPTRLYSPTPTDTATATFTATPVPSFTATQIVATPTFTRTPTFTPLPSDVPTLTDTPTVVEPTPTAIQTIATPTPADTACNFGVMKTLAVGTSPKGIAVDASTNRVFVGLANAVAVIDANTLQVMATWQMNGTATTNGIAFVQGKLFITKRETGRVTVLDASNGSHITSLLVGNSPYGIGASGNRVWVANFDDSTVTLINADTNAVIATTPVSLYPALVAPLNDRAAVSAWGAGANVVDGSNQVDQTIALGNGTFGIAANSASQKIFTSNRLTKTLARVNLTTNTLEGSATESEAPYAVLLNPTLGHLWIVLADSNRVRVRNTANFGTYQTFGIGAQGANGGDSIGLLNDWVFVANNAAGTVTVLRDCAAPKPAATPVPTNTPTPTFDVSPTRLYSPTPAGCTRRPRLLTPAQDAQLTTRQVLLDWSDVACATYYRVQVVRNSTTNPPLANVRVTTSQYTVTKLPRGSTYYFRVRACDTRGCAPWTGWRAFWVKP